MSSGTKNTKAAALGFLFTLASTGATAGDNVFPGSERHVDLGKKFNMRVQVTPYTNPKNPAYRLVAVDCGKLGALPDGKMALTGSFVDQFDVPPLRPQSSAIQKTPQFEMMQASAALVHLGSLMPENHQMCVAQSETISGKAKRQGGRTSVPASDDRFCAPLAAAKICMKDEGKWRQTLSPVYKWDPSVNTLTLVPGNL